MNSHHPSGWFYAGVSLILVAVVALLSGCVYIPDRCVVVVQCDRTAHQGLTPQDSVIEEWRDSLVCDIKLRAAQSER